MLKRPVLWFVGGDDIGLKLPLLLAMKKRGYSIAAAGTEPPERFLSGGVSYWRYQDGGRPLIALGARKRLRRLFHEKRPDIVHAFDTLPGMLAPIEARQAGVRSRLCTVTGMGTIYSSRSPWALALRPLYRSLRRRGSGACGVVVFQNTDDRDTFVREKMVAPGRDRLIPGSGIDVDAFAGTRPGEPELAALKRELDLEGRLVVTMIARLVPEKGVGDFLEVASRIGASRTDVVFLMVGEAPRGREGRIRRLAAGGAIRWPGYRSDIPAILAASDMVVLPSRYREGVPRVLLEAGAMGLPMIATDMPGCRDVVRHGRNGLLVPPGDTAALMGAVLELVTAGEERIRMGARARDHVRRHFGLESVAEAYGAIYDDLMDGQPAAAAP